MSTTKPRNAERAGPAAPSHAHHFELTCPAADELPSAPLSPGVSQLASHEEFAHFLHDQTQAEEEYNRQQKLAEEAREAQDLEAEEGPVWSECLEKQQQPAPQLRAKT